MEVILPSYPPGRILTSCAREFPMQKFPIKDSFYARSVGARVAYHSNGARGCKFSNDSTYFVQSKCSLALIPSYTSHSPVQPLNQR